MCNIIKPVTLSVYPNKKVSCFPYGRLMSIMGVRQLSRTCLINKLVRCVFYVPKLLLCTTNIALNAYINMQITHLANDYPHPYRVGITLHPRSSVSCQHVLTPVSCLSRCPLSPGPTSGAGAGVGHGWASARYQMPGLWMDPDAERRMSSPTSGLPGWTQALRMLR